MKNQRIINKINKTFESLRQLEFNLDVDLMWIIYIPQYMYINITIHKASLCIYYL